MSHKRTRAAFESDGQDLPPHAPFALYGTPLPAYESDARDDESFVPAWKQSVTDEQGRKRLHGAFTGGWSAGYFNTVGSKEGWTPSTFVSSRANRAKDQKDGKSQEQRPEDFMDDEDLADQAESQKVQAQNAFAGVDSNGEEGGNRGMFADVFRTNEDTMGEKLLQRMGWKPGEGIGPKVKRRAEGDEKGEFHLFAPKDSALLPTILKDDYQGLGFVSKQGIHNDAQLASTHGRDEDEDSGDDARVLRRSKLLSKPKPLKKGAFGVGILNDTGSDDEDPYSLGPRINYNRTVRGAKQKKKGDIIASNVSSNVVKPKSMFKKASQHTSRPANLAGPRKCHDGLLPLKGFVLSSQPSYILDHERYAPPKVPDGWTPSKQSASATVVDTTFQSTADAAKASILNPKSRASVLGEQQLPGKSIFDFMSPTTRDRLAAATGKSNLPPGLGEKAPAGFEPSPSAQRRTLWDMVPSLDKQTALAALQRGVTGVVPYANDEAKRERYQYYLELSAGSQSDLPERSHGVSVQEWAKELSEFAATAEIFKPVTGIMASRFTAASGKTQNASDVTSATSNELDKKEDPAVKAARMGMYGPLTRTYHEFRPTRLLCKRFGVKPPANVAVDPNMAPGGSDDVPGENQRLDIVSRSSLNRMMMETSFKAPAGLSTESEVRPAVQIQRAVVDVERNEALEGPKAGEAVFKAIFGSDDEDD